MNFKKKSDFKIIWETTTRILKNHTDINFILSKIHILFDKYISASVELYFRVIGYTTSIQITSNGIRLWLLYFSESFCWTFEKERIYHLANGCFLSVLYKVGSTQKFLWGYGYLFACKKFTQILKIGYFETVNLIFAKKHLATLIQPKTELEFGVHPKSVTK